MSADMTRGLLDTNILVFMSRLDPAVLPDDSSISAVTLAELTAGVHGATDEVELAERIDVLQRTEQDFTPLPFDAEAARLYGRLSAAMLAYGRTPRRRIADLMIAATASANGLPLYTINPDDFAGLDKLVDVRPVRRPD